ncbi:sarcoplasmic calcium-binding proteins I, III, and IV [Pieris rapae]|uniref:sarcoplasmic calcium-binding proteins I, III, and IV n=1 Tax=Pieris rapae TaxID=64459 RepID=UPI000B92849F|nr:sarcoplasmic calcium-binding proteins I, III, and IV [Pieris rapae]
MVSDFRKKKLLHVFTSFFDRNGSGSIDKKDFELAVENISKLRGWAPGDAKYKETQSSLMKIWDALQGRADSDKDGEISVDEWVSMWDEYAKNPSGSFEWQNLYCKFIFNLEDASGDGAIDGEEFSSVYASFGLSKDDALAAFRKMSQGKANVSWSEFQDLWKAYFTSEDPNAAGNFIFGKTSF